MEQELFDIAEINVPANDKSQDRTMALVRDGIAILALADGAGGMSGGAEAAEIFVQIARDAAQSGMLNIEDIATFTNLLSDIDLRLSRHPDTGESTGVVLMLSGAKLAGASVGDSVPSLLKIRRVSISESRASSSTSREYENSCESDAAEWISPWRQAGVSIPLLCIPRTV